MSDQVTWGTAQTYEPQRVAYTCSPSYPVPWHARDHMVTGELLSCCLTAAALDYPQQEADRTERARPAGKYIPVAL
jgi:hypothetical protein